MYDLILVGPLGQEPSMGGAGVAVHNNKKIIHDHTISNVTMENNAQCVNA